MSDPRKRVGELLAETSGPDVRPARLLCDRHAADHVAFTVVGGDLSHRDITYGELRVRSEHVAAALASVGIGEDDRVATLMGKGEELVITLMAVWRLGAVHVPLFTAFAPAAIATRLISSRTKLVVCDAGQRTKLDPSEHIPHDAPWRVVLAGETAGARPGDLLFDNLLRTDGPRSVAARREAGDPLIHLFTSGTTGSAKAVPVPVKALAAFATYMEYGLDVRDDDVFWNAADPGWAYGLYYGIVGPLVTGRCNLLVTAGFDAGLTWEVLRTFGVTNLAAAPTVYRALRAHGEQSPDRLRLRACSSAGEPLNPEVIEWAQGQLGVPIRDQYGQTEVGMTIVNGWHRDIQEPLRPGSMGRPMPGFSAAALEQDTDTAAAAHVQGRVAIDVRASPLMWFTGYVADPQRTAERFSADGRWYFTGDLAHVDDRGAFFSSRDDDVIIMAGYRVGPFEVESALISHPAVVEAAVIGAADELRGEVVEAYVVLRTGVDLTPELAAELQQHVKTRYAAHAYPRRIHTIDALPRTPSGKIQRFALRERRREELPAKFRTIAPERADPADPSAHPSGRV